MFKSIRVTVTFISISCFFLFASSVLAQGPSEAKNAQFNTKDERIGSLRLEMPEKEVGSAISCKPGKGNEILEGATGEYVQVWKYPKCGVILKMNSERKGGPKTVAEITIASPSGLKTDGGIHIGSTESEVVKAYGRYRDTEGSVPGRTFVAGSIYDGMIFTLKNGRVVKIFLGAAAE